MSDQQQTVTIQQAIDLGEQHRTAGRFPEAKNIYQQILQTNPDQPVALHLLGVVAHQVGKNDIAVDLITKAIVIEPDYVEAHYNLGNAFTELGKLDEAVVSYRKALAIKPDYTEAHNNLGLILRNLGKLDEAVESYHKAIAIKPDFVLAHYNLGLVLQALGKLDEAVASYHKAIAIKPDYVEAHYDLGLALQGLGKLEDAVQSHHRALAIKPDYTEAHNNIAVALQDLGKLDEAAAYYHKALAINSDYVEAHNNLGKLFIELGKLEEAVASYRTALAIKPDHVEARKNFGMLQLFMGDFQNGWENYNFRWLCDDYAPGYKTYGTPLWQGAAIDGKSLLVYEEQGVGETILFASMIPDLIERGADVIFECDKRLILPFSRSFPSITCVAKDDPDIGNAEDKMFDLHVPLGNAARWLRADLTSFSTRPSYLVADSRQRQTIRKRYLERGNDLLVGISWHSQSPHYGQQKSMTLDGLRPLLEVTGITFVNLQYGDTCEERKAFTTETGIEIFHDNGIDPMDDLDMFTSQVAAMDMVVTISNTTAHIAGALGVPTLLLLGTVPIWYWLLEREDSPWYPSLHLFRQKERGNWQGVVERARNELAVLVGDR